MCGLSNNSNSDDLEWPSRSFVYCKPFKCDFSHSCAAVDKISIDVVRSYVRGPSAMSKLRVLSLHASCSKLLTRKRLWGGGVWTRVHRVVCSFDRCVFCTYATWCCRRLKTLCSRHSVVRLDTKAVSSASRNSRTMRSYTSRNVQTLCAPWTLWTVSDCSISWTMDSGLQGPTKQIAIIWSHSLKAHYVFSVKFYYRCILASTYLLSGLDFRYFWTLVIL